MNSSANKALLYLLGCALLLIGLCTATACGAGCAARYLRGKHAPGTTAPAAPGVTP